MFVSHIATEWRNVFLPFFFITIDKEKKNFTSIKVNFSVVGCFYIYLTVFVIAIESKGSQINNSIDYKFSVFSVNAKRYKR